MQVILIGSGNIAGLMGSLLLKNGHSILQVYSRNINHAEILAVKLNAQPISDLARVSTGAAIYIVSVADDALPVIAAGLRLTNELVIHTSGTASLTMLSNCSTQYGVLWPVKMVRATTNSFSHATMVMDGNNASVIEQVKDVAAQFSEKITVAGDAVRARMHMIATFTSNFSNHLFHLAADYCEKADISFDNFYPLIEAAIEQLREHHPHDLQAGPALRSDRQTILKHQELLANEPQMKKIYDLMTASILASFPVKTVNREP